MPIPVRFIAPAKRSLNKYTFDVGRAVGLTAIVPGISFPLSRMLHTAAVKSGYFIPPIGFLSFPGPALIFATMLAGFATAVYRGSQEPDRAEDDPYRVLFEECPVPTWVVDTGTLAFLTVNRAAIRCYGYSRNEFLAMTLRDIQPEEGAETAIDELVNQAEFPGKTLWRLRKKDDSFISVQLWVKATTFSNKSARLIVATDALEGGGQRVDSLTGELARIDKELEILTYAVSHDLRAPLRHVDAFSRMLEERSGAEMPEDARHYMSRIRESVLRMTQLMDGILNLAHINRQQLKLRMTDLTAMVRSVIEELTQANSVRSIEWKVAKLPPSGCDPDLMRQVFVHLLSNAVKFTRPRQHAVIEIGADPMDGAPIIFVKDNGVGFNMDYADKLFGVFQRFHSPEDFEGAGIGLAIAQRVIRRHHGRMWALAAPNNGCTIYFSLGGAA